MEQRAAVYIDSLSPDIDPAEVALLVAQMADKAHGEAPRARWLPLAARVAQIAETDEPLGHQHELAVVAHLAAMTAHTFATQQHVQDTSPLLVAALIDTEQQDVCGFSRSTEFVQQLHVLAATLQQNVDAKHVLIAGAAELDSPDYEAYMRRADEAGIAVTCIDPAGKSYNKIAREATRRSGVGGAALREYL